MSLDALETLSKFTSPLLIPLPPSPPPRVQIPSRRPKGWVSVAPRLGSGRFVALAEERRASAGSQGGSTRRGGAGRGGTRENARLFDEVNWEDERVGNGRSGEVECSPLVRHASAYRSTTSGSPYRSTSATRGTPRAPAKGGSKRVVSGTMQYALLPPSPPPSPPSPPSTSSIINKPITHGSPSIVNTHHRSRSSSSGSLLDPPPPSTASPRSESLQTPLPGVDFHIPPPPTTEHPHIHIPDLPPRRASDGADEAAADVYHLAEADNDQAETSFRSVSEADSADLLGDEDEDEGDRWVGEVLAEREADEERMEYVRTQLNALFPDFFAGDQSSHDPSPVAYPIPALPPQHTDQTQRQWDYSLDPIQAGRQAVNALPLPGVRSEMGNLREEIERLRGVVGELAAGLTAARRSESGTGEAEGWPAVRDAKVDIEELEVERMVELDEGASEAVRELVSQNADQIIHLLRTLDKRLDPGRGSGTDAKALLDKGHLAEMTRRLQGTTI